MAIMYPEVTRQNLRQFLVILCLKGAYVGEMVQTYITTLPCYCYYAVFSEKMSLIINNFFICDAFCAIWQLTLFFFY